MKQERITAAEFRQQQATPKRNKFGAKRTVLDGIVFDSKAEADRWAALRLQERAGAIYDLRRQVWHHLKAANGAVACRYRADFDYFDTSSGLPVTEDVKSPVTAALESFRIKRAMFREQYGRDIKVVMK